MMAINLRSDFKNQVDNMDNMDDVDDMDDVGRKNEICF